CQLSVVSCQLSVVSCQLSVVSCQLSVVSLRLVKPWAWSGVIPLLPHSTPFPEGPHDLKKKRG
ncbi:MAG TPA: hypothetical protein PKB07_25510, partial [Flavilitoribacter sp.]|nr:hypothetical protein [Flavilitoribacter sp.]